MIRIIEKNRVENFQNKYKMIRRVVFTTIERLSNLINQRALIDKNTIATKSSSPKKKKKENEEKPFLKIELRKD